MKLFSSYSFCNFNLHCIKYYSTYIKKQYQSHNEEKYLFIYRHFHSDQLPLSEKGWMLIGKKEP